MNAQAKSAQPRFQHTAEHQNLQALKQCVQMMQQYQSGFQLVIEDPNSGDRYLIMERDDRLHDRCIAMRTNAQNCQIMSDCFPIDRDHMGFKINARFDKFTENKQPLNPALFEAIEFVESALKKLPCIVCERIPALTKTRYIWEPDKQNAWQS